MSAKVLMERMYEPKESIVHRGEVKANHLFLNLRDGIQTNSVFSSKYNDQNGPFFVKLRKGSVGVYMLTKLLL